VRPDKKRRSTHNADAQSVRTVVHAAAVEHADDGLGLRADGVVEGGDALEAHAAALVHVHVAVFHLCRR
jgi:hypothetical protein